MGGLSWTQTISLGLCYLRPWEVDVPLEQLQKCVRQSGSDYCGSSIFHHCINVNSQRIDDFGRRLEQQTASINHLTDDFIYFTRLYSFSIFIIAGHEIPLCFRPAHTRGTDQIRLLLSGKDQNLQDSISQKPFNARHPLQTQ